MLSEHHTTIEQYNWAGLNVSYVEAGARGFRYKPASGDVMQNKMRSGKLRTYTISTRLGRKTRLNGQSVIR